MKNEFISKVLETKLIDWQKASWFQNDTLKEITEEGLIKLKESLKSNSFIMPFHVWENEDSIFILDGHHRQKALLSLVADGVEVPELLPATFINCTDKKEAAKFVLIYSSIYAKIQNKGLDEFIKQFDIAIEDFKFEIDLPDFSLPRFEQKFSPIEINDDSDDDPIEENEDEKIIVSRGDVFQLNGHLIGCLDCTKLESWVELLGEEKADMIFNDPPYNLKADYIGNLGKTKHKDFHEGAGEMSEKEFRDWLELVMKTMVQTSRLGSIHYICMDFRHCWHMVDAASSESTYNTLQPKQLVVWDKGQPALGDFYRAQHELVFIFKNGTEKHFSNLRLKDRIRTNVWKYPSGNSWANPDREQIRNHPTPKPVALVKDAILDVTKEGEIILDFFTGSGTTLIASDLTGRIFRGTEIEPKYMQSIIKRFIRHCNKYEKPIEFKHINGKLEVKDFD